jgi:hypothetical protein
MAGRETGEVPCRAITVRYASYTQQRFQLPAGLVDNGRSIDGVKYIHHVHSLRLLKP